MMNNKECDRQARSHRWGKAVVEKSGKDVVRVNGMRLARGRTARPAPNLRIGRNRIVGPTEDGGAGALRRPGGFGRV
jgi:hypothetical protein